MKVSSLLFMDHLHCCGADGWEDIWPVKKFCRNSSTSVFWVLA